MVVEPIWHLVMLVAQDVIVYVFVVETVDVVYLIVLLVGVGVGEVVTGQRVV